MKRTYYCQDYGQKVGEAYKASLSVFDEKSDYNEAAYTHMELSPNEDESNGYTLTVYVGNSSKHLPLRVMVRGLKNENV